jgi:hypothetical protein
MFNSIEWHMILGRWLTNKVCARYGAIFVTFSGIMGARYVLAVVCGLINREVICNSV